MAYNLVNQVDHEEDIEHQDRRSNISSNSPKKRLFLDTKIDNANHDQEELPASGKSVNQMIKSITSNKSTKTSGTYDILEEEDYDEEVVSPALSPERKKVASRGGSTTDQPLVLNIPRPRPLRATATILSNSTTSPISHGKVREPIIRTASGRSITLRHPTPDLQTLQGAYLGNIDKLERTAERLSMTSSIEDAIRELHTELKRSDSRRSSMLSQLNEMPQVSRQVSNASSIVELNSAARSGGYSPAGYMRSPKGSFSATTRGPSASKSSRFGSRPEPELEGRALDSVVNSSFPSLVDRPTNSIAEQDESSLTMTRPLTDQLDAQKMAQNAPAQVANSRPQTAASTNTYEQAEGMFADFDGIHSAPLRPSSDDSVTEDQRTTASGDVFYTVDFSGDVDQNRMSSATMATDDNQRRTQSDNKKYIPRPQSYADQNTGQQMVYYPAPVPIMLSLPQKLSKNPSSMARNKRRSQVLSNIPAAARQSAIWLPDLLESTDEQDDEARKLEYIPQHQRMSMGGRRNTQDLDHLPPQLRANAFFELPGHSEVVELKEQSAVATLDSILDASANAPVNAFIDHAFAGHLGAEVYGKAPLSKSRSSQVLLAETEEKSKKRASSINLLLGRRGSGSNMLDPDNDKRAVERKTTRSPIEDDDDDGDSEDINNKDTTPLRHFQVISGSGNIEQGEGSEEEDEGQQDDEIYHGPPTTLLAELQLRKQQQKSRTRPLTSTFPNGVHSTLLEMDTVLQLQQQSRKQKQVNLAWQIAQNEDPDAEDDEDVPLAMLNVAKSRFQDTNRPLGLMEKRDMEDNEPLSRRKARLTGQPMPMNRATSMMQIPTVSQPVEEEEETLAQRIKRLKEGGTATGLPATRPVSGDFASEMMSQFGDLVKDDDKGKGRENAKTPAIEEVETLGQRRKRLQAEREARAKEVGAGGEAPQDGLLINKRRSMADLLVAHPAAGASAISSLAKPSRPISGLLGLHEQRSQQRASTMTNLVARQIKTSRTDRDMYNDIKGQTGMGKIPQPAKYTLGNGMPSGGYPQFAQPTMAFNKFNHNPMMPYLNSYANLGCSNTGLNTMGGYTPMGMQMQNIAAGPTDQVQLDMVERWRQSVMH